MIAVCGAVVVAVIATAVLRKRKKAKALARWKQRTAMKISDEIALSARNLAPAQGPHGLDADRAWSSAPAWWC